MFYLGTAPLDSTLLSVVYTSVVIRFMLTPTKKVLPKQYATK